MVGSDIHALSWNWTSTRESYKGRSRLYTVPLPLKMMDTDTTFSGLIHITAVPCRLYRLSSGCLT